MTYKAITQPWDTAISDFLIVQRAGGKPQTTLNTRRQQLQHLARRVTAAPWELTADELLAYVGAQEWAQETRRGRTSAFREFWRWAKHTKRTKQNIAKKLPKVKASQPDPHPIPEEVYAAAQRRADDRTKLILRLAYEAGLRRGEIALVHSDDLIQDLIGWSLRVHGKGRKTRIVPLTPRLALDVRAAGDGWLFDGDIDGHLSPRRVGELAIDVLDDGWTLHSLRHSFATRTHDLTGDTLTVQKLLGHASADTTRHYVLITDVKLRDAVYLAAGVKPALTPKSTTERQAV